MTGTGEERIRFHAPFVLRPDAVLNKMHALEKQPGTVVLFCAALQSIMPAKQKM